MSKIVGMLALLSLGTAILSGCDQDLGLEGKTFSCSEQSDCADGFECDMDRGVCVNEGSGGTEDATDDTTDAQDSSDPSDTQEPMDAEDSVDPGDVEDAEDVEDTDDGSGSCNCTGGLKCTDAGDCVECLGAQDCEAGQTCNDAGQCLDSSPASCDALRDCLEDDYCTLEGLCEPISGTECSNHGGCTKFEELCTDSIQQPGICSLWRCEYSDMEAGCPSLAYCSRENVGESEAPVNICLAQTCDPDPSTASCSNTEDCVPVTETKGRCEKIGSGVQGEECGQLSGVGTVDCARGLTCVIRPGASMPTCQKYCNPWSSSATCSNSEVCAPLAGEKVTGVCLRAGAVDCADRLSPPTTPCGQRSMCLVEESGTKSCSSVCRIGEGDCTGTEDVCNPSRVPGAVGYGRCERRCQADSDCSGEGEVCRTITIGSTSFNACAETCRASVDCSGAGSVCKQGYCD
ncbi:MAG: hypothetical protein ACQEVA_02955 [Myxococcota bacterium]